MNKKPRVGILTAIGDFSPAYSLTGIILDQARALGDAGYDYDVITRKELNSDDKVRAENEGLRIRAEFDIQIPHLHKYESHERPTPEFESIVDTHFNGDTNGPGLKEILSPYDIVITHDLVFLDTFLAINKAIRKCIGEYPDKRWLHWIHSGPSTRLPVDEKNPKAGQSMCYPTVLRYSLPPNSKIISLNKTRKIEVARMYGTSAFNVRVVYNPKDIRSLRKFDEDTCAIIKRYDLFNHEIMQTYAFSTPRWKSKGVGKLLKVFGELKKGGVRIKLALINSHCVSDEDHDNVEILRDYATHVCGLVSDKDYFFASDYIQERYTKSFSYPPKKEDDANFSKWKSWRVSAPYNVVQNLTAMSNMFVFPSVSEGCSLIQAEASVCGSFMVLNRDFVPMMEFSPRGVLAYNFNTHDPIEDAWYYAAVAKEIAANFLNDMSIVNATNARTRTYNRDWIFRRQLEPLLYEGFSDGGLRKVK